MTNHILYCFAIIILFFTDNLQAQKTHKEFFPIQFTNNVPGNFTFHDTWEYKSGIYFVDDSLPRCSWGPPQVQSFFDSQRNIIPSKIDSYFYYIDSSKIRKTINSEGYYYSWCGVHHINFEKHNDTILIYSAGKPCSYGGVHVEIIRDKISSLINWMPPYPVSKDEKTLFEATKLMAFVDSNLFKKNILKLNIEVNYNSGNDKAKPFYFNARIYVDLNKPVDCFCLKKHE